MSDRSQARRGGAPGSQTDLWHRPGYLVRRLHQIHVALFIEECAAFNITPVQYAVMTILLNRPGIDQITLANDAGIDRTNVADVLGRLEDRGFLVREPGTRDRRTRLARLTAEGESVTRDMEDRMLRAQERFVSPLSEKERETLMQLMLKLVQANNTLSRAPARDD